MDNERLCPLSAKLENQMKGQRKSSALTALKQAWSGRRRSVPTICRELRSNTFGPSLKQPQSMIQENVATVSWPTVNQLLLMFLSVVGFVRSEENDWQADLKVLRTLRQSPIFLLRAVAHLPDQWRLQSQCPLTNGSCVQCSGNWAHRNRNGRVG